MISHSLVMVVALAQGALYAIGAEAVAESQQAHACNAGGVEQLTASDEAPLMQRLVSKHSFVAPSSPSALAQLRGLGVVLRGASGLLHSEAWGENEAYAIARVGPVNSSWDSKLRGTGFQSQHGVGTDVTWNMGMVVHPTLESGELTVQVWEWDRLRDDFLGEATVPLSEARRQSEDSAFTLPLGTQGRISLEVGPTSILNSDAVSMGDPEPLGPQKTLKEINVDEVTADGPFMLGTDVLPPAMQGIFWLSDQGSSSALVSFGGPTDDGGGCGQGQLIGNEIKMRISGDRTWSMASRSAAQGAQLADFLYVFTVNDVANPTFASIYPEWGTFGVGLNFPESISNFTMFLKDSDADYPGSVVWQRNTTIAGSVVGGGTYRVVQVFDGQGRRLEPAWSAFAEYQHTNGDPDKIYYWA